MGELEQERRLKRFGARRMAATYGLPVFPIKPNAKTPAIEGWQKAATRDPKQIDVWWDENPDYNIGVSTQGLVVVDIDVKKDGLTQWQPIADMHEMLDELPKTLKVETWSGGLHIYHRAPEGVEVRNSVSQIAEGVDIRADGGYVVGPGSIIDGRRYDIVEDGADPEGRKNVALSPAWLVEQAKRRRERSENAGVAVVEESQRAIDRAWEWAREHAPEAHENHGGDATTHLVAKRLFDFGVSSDTARETFQWWNQNKAFPPWDGHALEDKLIGGMKYRQKPIGIDSPDYMPLTPELQPLAEPVVESVETKFGWLRPKWRQGVMASAAKIPPLRWFIKNFSLRGKVCVLTGPGGIAKSTESIHIGLEGATGIKGVCGLEVMTRERVWIWNQEDDDDDIARRVTAVMQHKGLKDEDLLLDGRPMLSWNSGVEHRLLVAHPVNGAPVINHQILAAMKAHIITEGIGVLILDNLAELHDLDENKNGEMRMVLGAIRDYLAAPTGCAVIVIAHPVKTGRAGSEGLAGNMDSLRGAGSQGNSVRGAATLYRPSKADIKKLDFIGSPNEYARFDFAKTNFGKLPNAPIWFRVSGVTIANGDEIGVLTRVEIGAKIAIEDDLLTPFAAAVEKCGPGAHQLVDIEQHLPAPVLAEFKAMGDNKARDIHKLMLNKDVAFVEGGRLIRKKVGGRFTFSFEPFKPT